MLNHKRILNLIVIITALFLVNFTFSALPSQNNNALPISGMIMLKGKAVSNVKISIFEQNQLIDSVFSVANGKFSYKLALNSNYALVFDYVSGIHKILLIETTIPKDVIEIKPYRCIIRLDEEFVDDPENEERYSDFPIGIVKYSKGSKMFELNNNFSYSRIREEK